jgi:hypothetical protein
MAWLERMSMTLDDFLRRLPKVELHCHLLGSVRETPSRDLVRRARRRSARRRSPPSTRAAKSRWACCAVLRALDAWLLRTADDLHRWCYEYLQDAAAHHVRYAEFFWNPTGTAREGGHCLRRRCRRSAAPSRCRARPRHHRPADRRHRPRGLARVRRWRWCSG